MSNIIVHKFPDEDIISVAVQNSDGSAFSFRSDVGSFRTLVEACQTALEQLDGLQGGDKDVQRGTFACPICGDETPHRHSDEAVTAYRTKGAAMPIDMEPNAHFRNAAPRDGTHFLGLIDFPGDDYEEPYREWREVWFGRRASFSADGWVCGSERKWYGIDLLIEWRPLP